VDELLPWNVAAKLCPPDWLIHGRLRYTDVMDTRILDALRNAPSLDHRADEHQNLLAAARMAGSGNVKNGTGVTLANEAMRMPRPRCSSEAGESPFACLSLSMIWLSVKPDVVSQNRQRPIGENTTFEHHHCWGIAPLLKMLSDAVACSKEADVSQPGDRTTAAHAPVAL
jgi:hypothetical protein